MTNRQLKTFIKTRLDPVLAKGYYSTLINDKDNTQEQKKIRNSFLIFRSSSKAGAVEGIDIDYLSLDEYDRVPKQAEDSAIQSMSSSKFKYRRRWSTPTTPNYGIHDLYEHSDKKAYLHKCEHCGYYNKMEYKPYDATNLERSGNIKKVHTEGYKPISREVDDGTFEFVCKKCGKLLDRWYNGE